MSRVSPFRRRVCAAAAVLGLSCGALVTLSGGATAASLDPDRERELAQAHFQVYLLTHTPFRPSHITCTTPTGVATAGDLVCYAIVDGNETVAAVATPEGDHTFTFAAIGKASGSAPATPLPTPAPDPVVEFDLDAYMSSFEGDATLLESVIADTAVIAVESVQWQPEVSTLSVDITVVDPGATELSDIAWLITDMLASAWETGTPARAADVARQPRLEVSVDGVIYGTPFEVMVGVADYDIDSTAWLEITTVGNAVGAKQPLQVHLVATARTPRSADDLVGDRAVSLLA